MGRWLAAIALGAASLVAVWGATAVASTATKVIYVAPVNSAGQPLAGLGVAAAVQGHCEPGSDSVPGPVYRCFSGNKVIDPCWADSALPGSVLCMQRPWERTVLRLDTEQPLEPSSEPVPRGLGFPWGVKLANGERCVAAQGAHDQFRGRVVDYGCGTRFHLVLLRGMHKAREPWSFDSAIWTGSRYVPGPRETVRTAWYGGPAPGS